MRHRQQVRDSIQQKIPQIVGAIADLETLTQHPQDCDLIELRLDSLGFGTEVLDFAKNSPLPLLITARGAIEGGQSDWSIDSRAAAYQALMPYASIIDIELRDFDPLQNIISLAKNEGILIVGSVHDFVTTPSLDKLQPTFDDRPDIHKFALMANSLNDIKTQLNLLNLDTPKNLSVMGMGPLGAAARPLMAQAGSLLNYGYLGRTPTAPNQWPAALLKEALSV